MRNNMLDFEENKRQLNSMQNKLKELGESLWHCKFKRKAKRIRKAN